MKKLIYTLLGMMLSVGAWADNVAKIGTTEYATLAEAFESITDNTATTIELLADCSGNGIIVPSNRTITVNFNTHKYTVNTDVLAGSNGTKNQCFQLLRDSKVTFNNGSIVADNAAIKMIIQNYCDLTLTGMTIDATQGTNSVNYVVSNNNGTSVFGAGTTITAKNTGVAFDVYSFKNEFNYTGANVTVDGATINGKIEVSAKNDGSDVSTLGLNLKSGTINGSIVLGSRADEATITKSESVNVDAPAGYKWDSTGKLAAIEYTAQIGDVKYESLSDAIAEASADATITLLADIAVEQTILIYKNLTIDGGNHTITSSVTNKLGAFYVNTPTCNFTIQNATMDGKNVASMAVVAYRGVANATLDGIVATDNNNDGNNITLTDCTVKNFTGWPGSYVGAVYAFSHCHLTLTNCTFTGNTTSLSTNGASGADVWTGAATTVVINGGTYNEVFVNTNSSNVETVTINGGATIGELAICVSYKSDGSTNIPHLTIDNATVTTLTTEEGNPIPEDGINFQNGGTITNMPATEVAKILYGTSTKAFATLEEALEAATAEQTITLLADVTIATLDVINGKVIDKNGHNVTVTTFIVNDGGTFSIPFPFTASTATYTRTVGGNAWGTICVPFTLKSCAAYTLYNIESISADALTVTATDGDVAPGTPVIFHKNAAAATDVTFSTIDADVNGVAPSNTAQLVGTYSPLTIETGLNSKYFINGDEFHQAKAKLTVPAYRAYINTNGTSAKSAVLSISVDGMTAGIDDIDMHNTSATAIYDANGRQLPAPQKGMNIIRLANGKTVKLIIK